MQSVPGQSQGLGEAEEQVHILHGGVGPALADRIQHREDHDPTPDGIYIHADVAKIGARGGSHPGLGVALPGGALLAGGGIDLNEGLAGVEVLVKLHQRLPGHFSGGEGVDHG